MLLAPREAAADDRALIGPPPLAQWRMTTPRARPISSETLEILAPPLIGLVGGGVLAGVGVETDSPALTVTGGIVAGLSTLVLAILLLAPHGFVGTARRSALRFP